MYMSWYKINLDVDLSKSFLKKVEAGGKKLCIVNADGKLFATSLKCPHAGADLTKGWCLNHKIVCPYHRYEYDLNTGAGAPGQNDFITTYAVEQRSDGVYVEVKSLFARIRNLFDTGHILQYSPLRYCLS